MNKKKNLIMVILLLAGVSILFSSMIQQETAKELFEKALYLEETKGDLEKAIEVYKQVVKKFPDERATAAKALFHVGLCYEKLGMEKAHEAYQNIIDKYPDQVEIVQAAKEKLSFLLKAQSVIKKDDSGMKIRKVWEGGGVGSGFLGSVSPDGRYLSFPDWDTDGDLVVRDLTTGKTHRLTEHNTSKEEAGFASFAIWSPDNKKIAYAWEYRADEEEVLEVVGIDGSSPRILFKEKGEYVIPYDWSPDGRSILVSISNYLGLISVEDGSLQKLKTFKKGSSPIFLSRYKFSPDGRYIAYEQITQGEKVIQRDIYLYSIKEKTEFPLVKHHAHDFVIGWAPDGKHFLFGSDRDGSVGAYIIPMEDGKAQGEPELIKSGLGPLTPLGITDEGSFYYGLRNNFMDIYTTALDFDSGKVKDNPSRVALPYEGHNRHPQYSPDGKRLVYVSERGAEPNQILCIHSLQTGKNEEFKLDFLYLLEPQWSPDGSKILVTGIPTGTIIMAIHQVNPRTGEVTPLIPPEEGKARMAGRWSPDGKSIVYFDIKPPSKDSKPGYVDFEIVQRDLEPGKDKTIWGFNSANSIFQLLAVSPDGGRIAFVQRDGSRNRDILWVIPISGETPQQVCALDMSSIKYLEWTPDGQHIIFSSQDQKDWTWDWTRVSTDGEGKPEKLGIVMKKVWCFDIHPDGRRLAFASSGKTQRPAGVWVMENFLPKAKAKK